MLEGEKKEFNEFGRRKQRDSVPNLPQAVMTVAKIYRACELSLALCIILISAHSNEAALHSRFPGIALRPPVMKRRLLNHSIDSSKSRNHIQLSDSIIRSLNHSGTIKQRQCRSYIPRENTGTNEIFVVSRCKQPIWPKCPCR